MPLKTINKGEGQNKVLSNLYLFNHPGINHLTFFSSKLHSLSILITQPSMFFHKNCIPLFKRMC